MRRLTAFLLFALFCLIPASPLLSAAAIQDNCSCCGTKTGACCRLKHSQTSGAGVEAAASCNAGCRTGSAGLQRVSFTPGAATRATKIVQVRTPAPKQGPAL